MSNRYTVFWGYIVIHWLTFGSIEAEKDLSRSSQLTTPVQRVDRLPGSPGGPRQVDPAHVTTSEIEPPASISTIREFLFETSKKNTTFDPAFLNNTA